MRLQAAYDLKKAEQSKNAMARVGPTSISSPVVDKP
jgi:plasmid maintenance system antidote protein VapI